MRLFKRKKGGTRVGNFFRRLINENTYGLGNMLGVTDGHMVDGNTENGEFSDDKFR